MKLCKQVYIFIQNKTPKYDDKAVNQVYKSLNKSTKRINFA